MRKGDLVKLSIDKCFTIECGGKRSFPLTNYAAERAGTVEAFYKLTPEQRKAMANQDYFKEMDSAGESRLVPSEGRDALHRDRVYPLLRARAAAVYNYRKIGGLALVLDTESGRELYVARKYLENASPNQTGE